MMTWLQSQVNFSAVLTVALLVVIFTMVAYCIYFERKISAWIQDRKGPNRVGTPPLLGNLRLWGLGQPLADGLKFLLKEDIIPARVDTPLFLIAPCISLIVALIGFAVIPWGGWVRIGDTLLNVQVASPDIGLLYILGVGSMAVYGVVLGGWSSNNKYALYGAVRATAQMLSYEIPMGVALLVIVLTCGQIRLEHIVLAQVGEGNVWFILMHPVAFLILLTTLFAETNRAPFDLPECEQELVGGYHTEYSAMKFAMFFLGEYAHMITGSAFLAVLFFGGWHLPFIPGLQPGDTSMLAMLAKIIVMLLKISFFIFFFMWVRWTLPRFRFDQLMRLAWKGLIPMSLGLLVLVILGLHFGVQDKILYMLPGNIIVFVISMLVAGASRRPVTGRQSSLPPLPTAEPAA
jgi:NADH-quinone oxidoreductase subunit H